MLKVFLLEKDISERENIHAALAKAGPRYCMCGETAEAELALPMIQELKPDLLVMKSGVAGFREAELFKCLKWNMPWLLGILINDGPKRNDEDYALLETVSYKFELALDIAEERFAGMQKRAQDPDFYPFHMKTAGVIAAEKFLEELILGGIDSASALDRATMTGMNLKAEHYLAAEAKIEFEVSEYQHILTIRNYVNALLKERTDVLWFFRSFDRLVLLLKDSEGEDIYEKAYALSQNLKYALERTTHAVITIGIGLAVDTIEALPASYTEALKVHRFVGLARRGQIIGATDIEDGEICGSRMQPGDTPVGDRLRYACKEDIPDILGSWTEKFKKSDFQSALMGYYLLTDVLLTCARLISELGGDYHVIIPELEDSARLFELACSKEKFAEFATEILGRTLDFRNASDSRKYGRIIATAKDYIIKHGHEPHISLYTVAKNVTMTPYHFGTLFYQEAGETFLEFLNRIRKERGV